ncbi:PorP/SprF family type IX secretion system membrane protein [Aurantibacillus circumpalustris]|uniref:PorP/SprF family type IX secretion system membrane protein n=1 Tax=Aurantibacillus circumpalustris TaxID=3036359 RepID=UPI00295C2215|nr:PorP/SprF family type IX secretion system membrane protein [Aurantibacillus circumpalustris]
MKKIKYSTALLVFTLSSIFVQAQDIRFSQVCETPLLLSPANTGFFNGYFRAIVNYRNQWAAMNNAFSTAGISVDGGLFKSKKRPAFMGIGFTFFRDQAGAAKLRKNTALLNLSGLVKIGKQSALSVGLALGTTGTDGNFSDLTYASQYNGNYIDPGVDSREAIYRSYTTVDLGAGVAYDFARYKRDQDHDDVTSFRIALGAFHLNRPNQEFGPGSAYKMPIRWTAALTSVLDMEDTKFTLSPTLVYQLEGKYEELFLGSYVKYRMSTGTKVTGEKTQNAIGFGLFYRVRDAIVAKLIFDLGDVSIGMAYDANVSSYRTATKGYGGFEVSLRYNILASSLFESRKEYK